MLERGRTYAGEPPDHDPRPERLDTGENEDVETRHCVYLVRHLARSADSVGAWRRTDSLRKHGERFEEWEQVVAVLPFYGPEGSRDFAVQRADAYQTARKIQPTYEGGPDSIDHDTEGTYA